MTDDQSCTKAWLILKAGIFFVQVDMLVGDIYGDRDYSSIGLSASTIASSFGRVVSEDLDLGDVQPADVAMALCRMVSYNIAHLSYLNAKRYGLPRIFFGGCVLLSFVSVIVQKDDKSSTFPALISQKRRLKMCWAIM